jgi:hypothetical protein
MRWWCERRERPLPKACRSPELLNHAIAAKRGYRPGRYDGRVVFVRTCVTPPLRSSGIDRSLPWREACPALEVGTIRANRADDLSDPLTRSEFARVLSRVLAASGETAVSGGVFEGASPHGPD